MIYSWSGWFKAKMGCSSKSWLRLQFQLEVYVLTPIPTVVPPINLTSVPTPTSVILNPTPVWAPSDFSQVVILALANPKIGILATSQA